MPKIEKFLSTFELKALQDDGTFAGYGSVFGNVDSQNESVAKGAFAKSLANFQRQDSLPAMLWMHDPTQPIGAWMSMQEDEKGLAVEGKLALATKQGAEAYELLKMNALKGLSIGYRTIKSHIDQKTKARILDEVKLFEISLVTFPANEAAGVTTVKAANEIKTIRDFEDFLRDEGGFSCAAARDIARGGFKARPEPRDEDDGLDELAAGLKHLTAILQST